MNTATRWIVLAALAIAALVASLYLGGSALALPLLVGLIAGAIAGRTARARA